MDGDLDLVLGLNFRLGNKVQLTVALLTLSHALCYYGHLAITNKSHDPGRNYKEMKEKKLMLLRNCTNGKQNGKR